MAYVPLWNKTNYSFLQGASHPEELVDQAHALGLPALAITDVDGVYGIVKAYVRARERGIKLLVGAQITLSAQAPGRTAILLAQGRRGYGQLCQLISKGRGRCSKGQSEVSLAELQQAGDDLVVLTPCPQLLAPLSATFATRLYGMVVRHLHPHECVAEARMRAAAQAHAVPLVAAHEVLYHSACRRPLHDVLTCIHHGTTLHKAGTHLRANGEHALKSPYAMDQLFADQPHLVRASLEVAQRCTFSMQDLRYRYPGSREVNSLGDLAWSGARKRYGTPLPGPVEAQLTRELELIHELDYDGYFLTMYDIVQFCKQSNILCQGRGSAANSIVCFALEITAIDPIKMKLLFERFLSRERAEAPDIDLDIEHQRREEVIQWIYQRYGRRHAAMVANVVRFRVRSAVREVGKVLGLPPSCVDRLAKIIGHYDGTLDAATLSAAGLDPAVPVHQHLVQRLHEILDFPRHLSIHPGGFLLGHDPVDTLVPIEPATMENRTVVQWDKQDVEDLGLFKVDILGLGALTHVHKCFDLIAQCSGDPPLTMAGIPEDDAATYAMICKGDTVGVFQIESRAQMTMLPRLQPRVFYDLVIEVAIVRPGPIQGGMVHPYLRRRMGIDPIECPHPAFAEVLEKTCGVPIFQEQVMKLAILCANYTPGEADQLRRDMAAWRSAGRIEAHRDKLIQRMIAQGVPQEFAERVFAQIRGFGEYGFPESHAASFAHIALVTAWLKCHHPTAFTCALLNAQPMGFYSAATIVEDAKRHQVAILPIDINHSAWDCTLQPQPASGWAVRMGLRYVKGFGEPEKARLAKAAAPFASLGELVKRCGLSQKALVALAEAGGCDSLGLSRRDAIWAVRGLAVERADTLSIPAHPNATKPRFAELSVAENVLWDYRTSFHSARGHPMGTVRAELQQQRIPSAVEVNALPNKKFAHYAGLVICRQRPQTASGVVFLTIEDETGWVNVVVWQQVFAEYMLLAKTATFLGVSGVIQSEANVVHLVARRLWAPTVGIERLGVQSRDFH